MDRVILHSDLNNFYASVECVLNPELRDKYVAVCGRREDRHGIVLAKNMKAKKRGVKTGEAIWEAKIKCPELVVVTPQFNEYIKYSKMVRNIYLGYTDKIEAFGMDECWLDVTGSRRLFGDGEKIAEMIRCEVKEKTGLTVSVGVSFNKIFAKLGSDMKKPDAVTVINREDYKEKVWNLPVSELLNVGRASAKKLRDRGIKTIGDLANSKRELVISWLGKNGEMLHNFANGTDVSPVMPYYYTEPAKSVGHGITCVENLKTDREVWKVIFELTQDISHKLRATNVYAGGVAIGIKNSRLSVTEFSGILETPTHNAREIALKAYELFKSNYIWQNEVRAVSVRAVRLTSNRFARQLSLFENNFKAEKIENIENAIEEIRMRYGKKFITYGALMGDLKMPPYKEAEIILPSFRTY